MDRAEHLAWCKARAREYLLDDQFADVVTSMVMDLGKHRDTQLGSCDHRRVALGLHLSVTGDKEGLRDWIDDFT